MPSKALFLDRDGVINIDHGYVHKTEHFEFLPGIFELVRVAKTKGYKVIVVTNQAGIGRGYYTEQQFQALTNWMCDQFALNGGRIDAVYFCPFHPEHGVGDYKRESDCRKPAPGMLLQAQRENDIDMKASIFVGDKPSDMAAGLAARVATLLYLNGETLGGNVIQILTLADTLSYLGYFNSEEQGRFG
jgi:D-glycero-D-manno-heptose 1,7-bisphosphate phosphatase